jgi:outer membrane receptor protein involved in Fe transport
VLPEERTLSPNPRLSIAWLARPGASSYTRLRGSVGTGIRPPDAFDLSFTDNPDLKPERSVSGEAGVDQTFFRGHGLFEATAFANHYDDLIVAVGSFRETSRYLTDNISNARARGLELAVTLRGRLPARRPVELAARVSYTRLDSEILAVDGDAAAPPPFSVGERLPRRPGHQFGADISATSGRVSAFLRGGGRSSALDVEPSTGTFGGLFEAAGYQVWSTGAALRIGRVLEIFGRVENLFDRTYEEALGFPALGRRATVGLRLAAGR